MAQNRATWLPFHHATDWSGPLMLRPQQNRLLISAVNLDAMRFDGGVVFQGVVDDASVECVERFELDNISPAPNLFSCIFGLLDESLASLHSIIPDIDRYFGRALVL